ncbi:MAG: cytochrome c biogenesis protein CcdA [Candidatus Hydrogenedentota bacterium]
MYRTYLALVAIFLLPFVALAQGIRVDTDLLQDTQAAHPGATHHLAVTVSLEHGYHVNSNKPLESFLIATVLTVEGPEGVAASEVVYPQAIEVITGGSPTPMAVYEEEFVMGVALDVGDSVAAGDYPLNVSLRYQACNDTTCLQPMTLELEATLTVVSSDTALTKQHEAIFAGLIFAGGTGEAVKVAATEPEIESDVAVAEEGDVMALLDRFDVIGTTGGNMPPDDFMQFIDDAEAGVVREGLFAGRGPIAIVLLVLIGGLALNMTPCVLPLIPINLAIIGAGAQSESRVRGFALGGAYGAAMAVVYGLLGLIVILTAGTFGTINASPWFNIGIAILFVVLGLAMFDVIQIDFTKFQTKFNLANKGKKGSLPLAFGMGGISALLAGACVAPIVIQVIVFSSDLYAKGNTVALALPFFLGLGMAIPWPLAGGGMSIMPKPGAWMVRVKQGMGVFILGFAAYYAYLAYEILDSRNVEEGAVAGSVQELLEDGWTPSLTAGLEQALEDDSLVLVDMWASWCKNCFVMDKTTLKDAGVTAALEDYVKVKYQSEDLEVSPTKEVLKRFDGIGLPTYAILRPKTDGAE